MAELARRLVLRGAAAAVLAPLAVGGIAAAAPRASVSVGRVSRGSLEAAVGVGVRIIADGTAISATLDQVRDLHRARPGHPDAFSAHFRLAAGVVPEQGLVDLVLPGIRITGAGLLASGAATDRTAVLLIDRRPIHEHLAAARA